MSAMASILAGHTPQKDPSTKKKDLANEGWVRAVRRAFDVFSGPQACIQEVEHLHIESV